MIRLHGLRVHTPTICILTVQLRSLCNKGGYHFFPSVGASITFREINKCYMHFRIFFERFLRSRASKMSCKRDPFPMVTPAPSSAEASQSLA